jgi:hypothetical protein
MLAVIFIISCPGGIRFLCVRPRAPQTGGEAGGCSQKAAPEHFCEMGPDLYQDDAENRQDPDSLRTRVISRHSSGAEARLRRETMVSVGLTVGGLAAVLAGIEFLNSLVTRLHWY